MTVANQGTAAVSNVSVVLDGGTSRFEIGASNGTSGVTPWFSPPERFSLRAWCPGFGNGSLAPGASATINVLPVFSHLATLYCRVGSTEAGEAYGRADLHLHTLASDGLMSVQALVDHVEQATDLDVMAITDHDETSAALEGREWAARHGYRVQVIPGVEITTLHGHLLALFIEDRPPALWGLHSSAEWVRQRGGLCIAAHPFTRWTHSLTNRAMASAVEHDLLAGIEVLNASPAGRASHTRAVLFNDQHGLAAIGSSDAHMLGVVGLARTRFRGHTADDLRRAIENRTTFAEGRFASPREIAAEALPQLARSMVHLPLRRLVRYARRASGSR